MLIALHTACAPSVPPAGLGAAPSEEARARIVSLGTTHEGHAITRGHNRKLFRSGDWHYAVWIDALGRSGEVRPQYSASRDLSTWAPPRDLSEIRNGGASGIDFETVPETGAIFSLEAAYDAALDHSYQFVRAWTAHEGSLRPAGPPVSVGAAGAGKAPPGYGSMTRDDDGTLWIVERDEKGVAGHGANAIIVYTASGATTPVFSAAEELPFREVAKPRDGVTRACRVLAASGWVVLVAYVEGPVDRPNQEAALYVSARGPGDDSWCVPAVLAAPGRIAVDQPRMAPDVRPSAWIEPSGRVWISWMPADAPGTVRVTRLDPPYREAHDETTALEVPAGRRVLSAQIRLDTRFTPVRAYLIAIEGARGVKDAAAIRPTLLAARFDGERWDSPTPLGVDCDGCLYLGMGEPVIARDDDPLAALTQRPKGAGAFEVLLIDATALRWLAPR